MVIIPAIDIIEGKCVRLTGGDYGRKKIYNEDPVAVAKEFEQCGITRLHLVDLDGAKAGGIVNHTILSRIAAATNLCIDFGGGIKRTEDIQKAFDSGAAMVTGGSIAAKNPELMLSWLDTYGPEKLILGADTRDGKIAVSGWLELSQNDVIPFILSYLEKGLRKVICTDISKDGMLCGSSIQPYAEILTASGKATGNTLELIASGGVTTLDELTLLQQAGLSGAIIGKAIYEGSITLEALAGWIEASQDQTAAKAENP